ncbi:MAG TPA: four helix bundle protein [Vicinamibacterales bacterium]|nr:four helix bundle protein [Vicinamibacterales bacterium]
MRCRMQRLRLEDVRAWQLAHAFTVEVCGLLKGSPIASADMRFCVRLFRSARTIEGSVAEAFRRGADEASARCLGDGLEALGAALVAVEDGIDRGYFSRRASEPAIELGRGLRQTLESLHAYLERCARTRGRGAKTRI